MKSSQNSEKNVFKIGTKNLLLLNLGTSSANARSKPRTRSSWSNFWKKFITFLKKLSNFWKNLSKNFLITKTKIHRMVPRGQSVSYSYQTSIYTDEKEPMKQKMDKKSWTTRAGLDPMRACERAIERDNCAMDQWRSRLDQFHHTGNVG